MEENYPTHLVSLWMDNDQGIYYAVRDLTRNIASDLGDPIDGRDELASALETYFSDLIEEMHPGLTDSATFVTDLFGASYRQVDWDALASELLAEDLVN